MAKATWAGIVLATMFGCATPEYTPQAEATPLPPSPMEKQFDWEWQWNNLAVFCEQATDNRIYVMEGVQSVAIFVVEDGCAEEAPGL